MEPSAHMETRLQGHPVLSPFLYHALAALRGLKKKKKVCSNQASLPDYPISFPNAMSEWHLSALVGEDLYLGLLDERRY
jgi:hypothetical protein